MGLHPFNGHQYTFDLRGEYVYSADDQHIIAAPADPLHAQMGPPAFAGLGVENRYIPGTVAEQGESFLGNGREDELPFFPVGQDLASLGVNNLGNEMVLENMETLFGLNTLNAHPGPDHFAQPVNVDRLDVEFSLNLIPHFLGPGFGPEDTDSYLQPF